MECILEIDKKHKYHERILPAYVISYSNEETLKAYESVNDGKLQSVGITVGDYLVFYGTTPTTDYEGRDDFNTIILRVFSL